MIQTKVIPYGTVHKVKVINASKKVLTVVGDDGGGYLLIGHGIDPLPEINELGTITFVKIDNAVKGCWIYNKAN